MIVIILTGFMQNPTDVLLWIRPFTSLVRTTVTVTPVFRGFQYTDGAPERYVRKYFNYY